MKMLTVKQVAKLSGVSVRALHHYDQIGLLKPASIGRNRYRYYGEDELLEKWARDAFGCGSSTICVGTLSAGTRSRSRRVTRAIRRAASLN